MLAGTFLPWVVSGGVLRNSYAIVGIVGRLGLLGSGFGATALSRWPLLGPVAMVGMIAGIVQLWRTAAVITLLFGLLTGLIGGAALAVAGGHGAAGVGLASTGPVVTLTGAIASVGGAVLVLLGSRRRPAGLSGSIEVVQPVQIRHRVESVQSAISAREDQR